MRRFDCSAAGKPEATTDRIVTVRAYPTIGGRSGNGQTSGLVV
jgi:hypothetical protein